MGLAKRKPSVKNSPSSCCSVFAAAAQLQLGCFRSENPSSSLHGATKPLHLAPNDGNLLENCRIFFLFGSKFVQNSSKFNRSTMNKKESIEIFAFPL
jgi:hypothetical protein